MRSLLALLLSALLAGCASAPPAQVPAGLWRDAEFAAPAERPDADAVFAVDEAMRRYLREDIADKLRRRGLQRGLVDSLRLPGELQLDYDSSQTRNARQAFAARSGNCLSLVILTAAMARELGLKVRFQQVIADELWSRAGDLRLASLHINVAIEPPFRSLGGGDNHNYTVDFLPPELITGQRTRDLSHATVVAMYMNNRAAEALALGEVDQAYWWAREAVLQQPGYTSGYNTLGVVYLRRGLLEAAEAPLRQALALDPAGTHALANLATVLERQGRAQEAQALQARLAKLEPHAPFHFFEQGLAAMARADYRAARDLFAREVRRADYNHEFHFWLALANWRLGDTQAAREELARARDASTTRAARDLYAAKLNWLRAH